MDKNLLIEIFVPTTEGSDLGVKATGYPVGARRVLTARHALFPDNRDKSKPIEVRWYHQIGKPASWREITKIAWDGGDSFDVALIDCEFPEDLPGYGMLSNEKPVDHMRWESEGFARAGRKESSRNPIPMMGEVHSAADAAREFHLGIKYHVALDQGWKGASGSPVFVDNRIIGVVTSCPENFDQTRLSATPTWKLLRIPQFRREIGYDDRGKISSAGARQWERLRNICTDITHHRMATVRGKYDKTLYLERDTVRQHVEAFLADPEKRGFILVGKSGVGKSNFLLALNEELHTRSRLCVLMYDAGSSVFKLLPINLMDIICKDFRIRSWLPAQQLWEEIAQIDGIGGRLVVLCVDALNENTQGATDLLRQLDEFVQSPWPWLKIIYSSRPETWMSIKRGVKLAQDLYYRAPGSENPSVELTQFSYSERMEIFPCEELQRVYRKYHDRYNLPDYSALSSELRQALRDPLNLRLLAKIVANKQQAKQVFGRAITADVKPSALIEEYVNTEEVLEKDHRHFLEDRLMMLMMIDGHYNNLITEAEIKSAGGDLYEKIYSDQVLSDGQRRNESFLKLCDADILVLEKDTEHERREQIKFKYERFYEYFAGKRLGDLSERQNDQCAFFAGLIDKTNSKPFFWGAVKNALVKESSTPNSETILKLCRRREPRVKDMMVNVLGGLDSIEHIENILRNLIPQEKQASEWQKIRYLVSKPVAETDERTRSARKIAIEVASIRKLASILQTALLHTDPATRAIAVRYTYYLWQHDRATGFAVIQYLAEKATTGIVPNCLALESIFGLSLIILCNCYRDNIVLSRLQGIWRGMIAKLFHVREEDVQWKSIVRDWIRERIITFVIAHIFSLLRELPASNMMNHEAIKEFFHLDDTDKRLYKHMFRYFDINGDYSKEQMEKDYLSVLRIDNVLPRLTTTMGLIAHACAAPHAFLPFLKQLFEAAKSNVATYPYLNVIYHVPLNVLIRDKTNDEMFEFLVYTSEVCQECYTKHPEMYHNPYADAPVVPGVGNYIVINYQREGNVKTAWLETRIQAALNNLNKPDFKFFELLLASEFPQLAFEYGDPKPVLAALELFFETVIGRRGESKEATKIADMIQAFLSRLRVYYPDQVEDFLAEQGAPDEFRLQVRTQEPNEKVGDLIGMRAWFFVRDSALLGPAEGRAQLIGCFEKAAECKNTQAWMTYVIRRLVNLVYGGEALRESG